MQKARFLIAVSCACASAACGTEIARAVDLAPGAGPPGLPEKPPVCMSNKITDRLLYGKVTLNDAVRYKRSAYFFGFPQDDRIAFSVSNNGGGQVAWIANGGTLVHVTPIAPAEFSLAGNDIRAGEDKVVEGFDVGGLVALDDGFALLTRRADPGEPIPESAGQATFLVRVQTRGTEVRELFAVPLTGTQSRTSVDASEKRDFPVPISPISLSGRLVLEGSRYGAYFGVQGGTGDRYFNQSSDKLVVVDEAGQFVSGFRAACRRNLGSRLLADTTGFVPFCMSDGDFGTAGLYAVGPPKTMIKLAAEVTFSSGNYAGGDFGSAVKLANGDGYVVVWASRGVRFSNSGIPAYESHAPAIALLKKDLTLVADPSWPFIPRTDGGYGPIYEDAVNVHAQAYGDKVLLVWETITSPDYQSNGVSLGNYGGTHFRLIDASGKSASEDEVVLRSIAPNGPDDIVQFPNGDIGWAYVPEDRYFQDFTAPNGVSALTEIRFVRLTYCVPPP